ncbi:LapA family protein [Marinococcus luteus]|uniref:LapA family protein n=1 Tax=Marinococcus luteus TaxID=1122204 RepID=UPI002ACCF9C6|nr:lipopolysaccharide assembly protein LapA domain-containing protein [Marinococcus luteus]MDZ5782883.1 lipopolysaccharide assembly protein LapA domain-containing protein [Marinococcus luteus]
MKAQTGLIMGLILALIIAIFAVINVNSVEVNLLFGTGEWPLIIVILVSVLLGAMVAGFLSMFRIYKLKAEVRRLRKASDDHSASVGSRTTGTTHENDDKGKTSRSS